jgi:hypothetical protein
LAAGHHAADNVPRAVHLDDLQLPLAIIQQDALAHAHIVDQLGQRGGDAFGGAFQGRALDGDPLAFLEHDRPALEGPDADLGPAQVGDDRQGHAQPVRDGADVVQPLGLLLQRAVREVQPEDVHARLDQLGEHRHFTGGRADGGDDFGFDQIHGRSVPRLVSRLIG